MKLSSQFTVPAEPERVFANFLDPDVMRTSIPGCTELVREDDTTYSGRLENVVAHVRFNARFSATIVSMDAPRQVDALLKGDDRKLGSSIKITARLTVDPDPAGSLVGYSLEMALWGKIGRLGEAIVRRRSVEIEREFVKRFAAACTDAQDATAQTEGAKSAAEDVSAPTTKSGTTSAPGRGQAAPAEASPAAATPQANGSPAPTLTEPEPARVPRQPQSGVGEEPGFRVRTTWWRRLLERVRQWRKGGADRRRTR